jgi:hypothetical protein
MGVGWEIVLRITPLEFICENRFVSRFSSLRTFQSLFYTKNLFMILISSVIKCNYVSGWQYDLVICYSSKTVLVICTNLQSSEAD